MREFKLKSNRYIVKFQNDFYVVNKKTKDIFEILNRTNNIQDFAIESNLSLKKAQKILSKLLLIKENAKDYSANLDLPYPLKVQWKMTNKCNLHCKHCYLGKLNQRSLDDKQILSIAKTLSASKIIEVTLTGGEVMLVPCLKDVLDIFVQADINVKMFTNGILLKGFLEKLPNAPALREKISFNISLDGLKNEHDATRGIGTFNKTIESIEYALSLGYNIVVNCVITNLNINSIVDMVALLYNMGVKNIQLSNLIIQGNADKSLIPSPQDFVELKNKLKAFSLDKNLNILYGDENENFENIYYDKFGNAIGTEEWRCCAGLTRCVVAYDGNVYCCPFCEKYKLGNILEQNLKQIWDNKMRFKFLKYLSQNKNKNGRMCIMAQGE